MALRNKLRNLKTLLVIKKKGTATRRENYSWEWTRPPSGEISAVRFLEHEDLAQEISLNKTTLHQMLLDDKG